MKGATEQQGHAGDGADTGTANLPHSSALAGRRMCVPGGFTHLPLLAGPQFRPGLHGPRVPVR